MMTLYRLSHLPRLINVSIFISFCLLNTDINAAHSSNTLKNKISNISVHNTDIAVTRYAAASNDIIVWLPSEHGLPDSVHDIALQLSNSHASNPTEVWVIDLLSALFLPMQSSSINQVPDDILRSLINTVYAKSHKRIFIVASGKGALLAMRSSQFWLQGSQNPQQLGGLILLYPNLFTRTPEPGTSADYYPIVHMVNVPIYILQPEKSPWRWQLKHLFQYLVDAKSAPYITILPNVRDRFYFRPDATRDEQTTSKKLAAYIHHSIKYLKAENITQYSVAPKVASTTKKSFTKKESKLRPYTQNPTPPLLQLATLNSKISALQDYRNKVVIVNFWASWCPPCVYEMPSMEKLYLRYPRSKFTILAVNMAEDRATITAFLQNQVSVSFPILLDNDGKALQDWQVFAFPSSFVIDKQSKIRYALFGSILWDTPEVTDIIDKLILE